MSMNTSILNYAAKLMVLTMVFFTSCSDDEKESGGIENSSPFPSLGITDPVTTIDYGGGVSTFNYVDGKMVGGYDYGYQELDMTISYSPLSIKGYDAVIDEDYSSVFELIYSNIQTNSMGFITSTDITVRETEKENGGESYVDEEISHCTAQYNEDGYLVKMEINASYNEDGVPCRTNRVITREWSEGNLKSIHWYNADYEGDSDIPVEEPDDILIVFTYNDDAPKNNGIYLDEMIYDSDIVTYAGFWGKTTKCIPITSEIVLEEGGSNLKNYYTVDTDDKGRIVALYLNGLEYMRYGYADQPLRTVSVKKNKSMKSRLIGKLHNGKREILKLIK